MYEGVKLSERANRIKSLLYPHLLQFSRSMYLRGYGNEG